MMASAVRMQTSTRRAMPQPGTPDPGWAEEGYVASATERKSSGQGCLLKEGPPPVSTKREPDAKERGARVAQRRPRASDMASPLTREMSRLYVVFAVSSSPSVHCACSSLALGGLLPKARVDSTSTEPGLLTGEWAAQLRAPAAGHRPPPRRPLEACTHPTQSPRPEPYLNFTIERPRKSSSFL